MSSVIDETVDEHINTDPDPSVGTGIGNRIRRSTVFLGIMGLGVLIALAIVGFMLSTARAQEQGASSQPTDPTVRHAGANASSMAYDSASSDKEAAQAAQAAEPRPTATYIAEGSDDTSAGGTPEPSPSADPVAAEAQLEAAERERAAYAIEAQRASLARDAIASDMRVGMTTSPAAASTQDLEGTASTEPSAPPATPRNDLITKTSGRFKLAFGDHMDATIIPNINPEAPGVAMICIHTDLKDSATGAVVLVPKGSCVVGIPGSVSASQERITMQTPILVFPQGRGEVDLSAIAADPDGTPGIGAHVDDHRWKVLSIAAIGGALSGLTTLTQPNSISASGVTITTPSVQSQVLSGVGAGVLQTAGSLAQAQMTRPPTLTAPRAKHIILYLEKDLYLDPYCDPDVPNSPECIVKGTLQQ